jgi:hypothetical protein
VIFVEVLDRGGAVARRERVASLPLRIGRSYANDLILDDPHVSPAHALLEQREDGALVLRDLGSRNGVLALPGGERREEWTLARGAAFRVGRTVLRFRDAEEPVPEALRLGRRPRWLEWLVSAPIAAVAWLSLQAGVSLLRTLVTSTAKIDWVGAATGVGVMLLLTLAWAGVWALFTRLLTRRGRFVAHLAISVIAGIAILLEGRLIQFGEFLVDSIDALQVTDAIGDGVILSVAIFCHLTVMRVTHPLRRFAVASALGLVLIAFVLGTRYQDADEWVVVLPYWSRLEPLPTRLLPVESEDEYFHAVDGIEEDLVALREEEPDSD